MYNRAFLIGRLVRDPELRYTPSGIAVVRFTLAINRITRKKEDNTKAHDDVDFIRIVAWRRLAEICNEYLSKGKLVYIEGSLQFSKFEKNGEKRTWSEVIADNMQILDRKVFTEMKEGGNLTVADPQEVPF